MAWYRDKFLTFNLKRVIKTLKRALQPVISDVSITWDLAQGWTVHQIPSSLPPLSSGDRLVVYGILKPSEYASRYGKMEVRLHGTLGKGEEMEFLITFPTPSTASASDTDVETKSGASIHCLAAKTFIKEKQDDISGTWEIDDNKKSSIIIISISKSANVGSKFTSFVAVDAENHQPVPGSLGKKVVPSFGGHMMGFMAAPQCAFAAPQSASLDLSSQSAILGGSQSGSKGGFGIFGSIKSAFSSASNSLFGGAPLPPLGWHCHRPPNPPPAAGGTFKGKDEASVKSFTAYGYVESGSCSSDEDWEDDFDMEVMADCASPPPMSFQSPSAAESAATSQQTKEASSVLALISLQKASGAWDLTDQLVSLCSKTRDALITGGPIEATSFPGSLLFTPQEAREGRPWLGLVTCLPKSGRLQISDWRERRLSVSLPILSVPGMGKHASVRINLQNRACFKGHVKWSRNPQKDV